MLRLLMALVIGVLGITTLAHADSLFDAAGRGDLKSVETFLRDGRGVDERGRNEETPLIAAALGGEVAIAKLLITHGANVMARNKGGLTPLHAAAYSGSAEVARLLLDHGAVLDDKSNISGTTPLIVAAEENRVTVAELLLARGADLTITDRDGFDALSQAWSKKRVEVVRVLKQHGATCQPVAILGSEEYYQRCVEYGQ